MPKQSDDAKPLLGSLDDENDRAEKSQNISLNQENESTSVGTFRQIMFGLGAGTERTMMDQQAYFLQLYFYQVLYIPASYVTIIMLIKQVWDTITDPVIGFLSDITRTRFGRRKPWIVTFILPTVIAYFLMWIGYVPYFNLDTQYRDEFASIYIVIILLLFSSFKTCYGQPYYALIPDISPNLKEATKVNKWVLITRSVMVLIVTTLQAEILYRYSSHYATGFQIITICFIPFIIFFVLVGVKLTPERMITPTKKVDEEVEHIVELSSSSKKESSSYSMKWFIQLFAFPPFTLLMIGFSFYVFMMASFRTNLILYLKFVLDAEDISDWVVMVYEISAMFGYLLFAWLSHIDFAQFFCKRTPTTSNNTFQNWVIFSIATFLCCITFCSIYFVKVNTVILFGWTILAGITRGCSVILFSAIPYVTRLFEMSSNKRMEGFIYSLCNLFQKIGSTFAIVISSYLLDQAGYNSSLIQQPQSVLNALTTLVTLFPGIAIAICGLNFTIWKISESRYSHLIQK